MNIVGIGIGGKGHPNLVGMKTENIIGLCDIDWKYAKMCIRDRCMVACGSRSSSTEVKDNVLTEEEKAEGYTLSLIHIYVYKRQA